MAPDLLGNIDRGSHVIRIPENRYYRGQIICVLEVCLLMFFQYDEPR